MQLKGPLKAEWEKITEGDLEEIQGNLATFTDVIQKRYGEAKKATCESGPIVGMPTGAETITDTKIPPLSTS